MHILSIKTAQSDNKLEFTLANIPTKGAYEFDVDVQFTKGPTTIIGIKIQRRKVELDDRFNLGIILKNYFVDWN